MPQIPSVVRGFLYPTSLRSRCPMYSRCLVTNKCQNYDKHQRICGVCELRVRPQVSLGGLRAEGEYEDDIQLAVKTIRDAVNAPFAHPDAESTSGTVSAEEYERVQHSTAVLEKWGNRTNAVYAEDDVNVQVSAEEYARVSGVL